MRLPREKITTGLAFGFFSTSIVLFAFVLFNDHRGLMNKANKDRSGYEEKGAVIKHTDEVRASPLIPASSTVKVNAKNAIDLVDLARAPSFSAGILRYQILGLGQNPRSGEQIVWVRSLSSNRVGGFAVGQSLFGGPVRVATISANLVTMNYLGDKREVDIDP